jgi:hypothetical protein
MSSRKEILNLKNRLIEIARIFGLGIEIVLCDRNTYFAHRREAIGGMANFDIAKNTLNTIGLDCPIWLVLRRPNERHYN